MANRKGASTWAAYFLSVERATRMNVHMSIRSQNCLKCFRVLQIDISPALQRHDHLLVKVISLPDVGADQSFI